MRCSLAANSFPAPPAARGEVSEFQTRAFLVHLGQFGASHASTRYHFCGGCGRQTQKELLFEWIFVTIDSSSRAVPYAARADARPVCGGKGGIAAVSMFRPSSGRGGQSFVEYALLLILVSIVLLSILLILGNDLRTFISDLLQRWFPATAEAFRVGLML